MNCAGCGRELVAHEVAVFEAMKREALRIGATPRVAGVCEDCADLPCCFVCDRPVVITWPHYACASTCKRPGTRSATCCSALCLALHMQHHHREELVS